VTGGIGAGKSEVLKILGEMGFPVLQADKIGHALLKERGFSKKLASRFGSDVLDFQGLVDRKKLGAVVFKNSVKRRELNQLLHPIIRQRIKRWVAVSLKSKKKPYLVALEIPLLFEGRGYPYLDGVVSVSAPAFVRHPRLARRGWDPMEIRRREKGQWTQARKDRRAHWVIRNLGSRRDLRRKVEAWLQSIALFHARGRSGKT
jgi:dephospho-CoA kinase